MAKFSDPVAGCLLGFSNTRKMQVCGAYRKCPGRGWQADEDEKRHERIRNGEMVRDPDTGCAKLVVPHAWYLPVPIR